MVTWPLLGTIQGLYLPNAWSHSLSKRHTFGVSAFHRYHWFRVKLFPVGCAQDSRRVPWNCKKLLFFGSGSPHATSLKFFTIAPVLISTLTACHRNRGDPRLYIGLQVHYKYYRKNHSRSGLAWSCPCANRSLISLNRPRSVFRTTNRCVQNFIYIGWDLALWGPKTYFGVKTDNGQAYAWLSKKVTDIMSVWITTKTMFKYELRFVAFTWLNLCLVALSLLFNDETWKPKKT